MYKKFIVIIQLVVIPLLGFSQHLEFNNISMESNIEEFEKALLQNGVLKDYCLDLGTQYDNQIDRRFYKITKNNNEYKLIVGYTKFSKSVYRVYVYCIYGDSTVPKVKYHEFVGKIISNSSFTIKDKGTQFMKFENKSGEIHVFYDNTGISIFYTDHENDSLCRAESFYLDKRTCKRLQKKYNNPLFYDNNPCFSKDW